MSTNEEVMTNGARKIFFNKQHNTGYVFTDKGDCNNTDPLWKQTRLMLDIDKKSKLIAVAVLVQEKSFKIGMQTFIWLKSGALKQDALECSQETQLKTVPRDFVNEEIDVPYVG